MATFQNSSDYIETKLNIYKNGELVLDHSGAYVAQYYVSWQELSYDSQGKEVLTARSWERNGQDLTAHFRASIPLKGNVRNLSIWGTTLYPQVEDKVKND